MNSKEKQQIIRGFLQNQTKTENLVVSDEDLLSKYLPIATALDWIEGNAPEIVQAPDSTFILNDILRDSCQFKKHSPFELEQVENSKLHSRTKFWQNELGLRTLPGCDYYERQTAYKKDKDLSELMSLSLKKLGSVIQQFAPDLDITNHKSVQNKISELEKTVRKAPNKKTEALIQQQLVILRDLNQINHLQTIEIPTEDGETMTYCTLQESAGGVTEKVSLIQRTEVLRQLNNLIEKDIGTLQDYHSARENFKLSTQAIIKLPKHGNTLEVQREALALNLSRILQLNTSKSVMLTHDGKPALFVPFDNIRLLNEVATGKTMQALLFSFATYSHYSTINPVGAGLEAEHFIEDFGKSLGLFYLCSDTDAIGGYNQNKAIKGNELYIFDQVMMPDDKLDLDSRLSMLPIKFITKHTRHDQGRNRTLIEDSKLENKFDALMQLKREKDKLVQYCSRVIFIHKQKIQNLDKQLTRANSSQRKILLQRINEINSLIEDAKAIRQKIIGRIGRIDEIFPKYPQEMDLKLVQQTLILEKLFNNPVFFTDDGRPYRNPWTHRHPIRVLRIHEDTGNKIRVEFGKTPWPEVALMLKRHGFSSIDMSNMSSDHVLTLTKEDLLKLTETSIYPEQEMQLLKDGRYLDLRDLYVINTGYGKALQTEVIQSIKDYMRVMNNEKMDIRGKLLQMQKTECRLKELLVEAKDKGFALHVLKKLHCDMQLRLQKIMGEDMPNNLDEAFKAAKKLDRLSEFNRVVGDAILNNKTHDKTFKDFLRLCIQFEHKATDHFHAKSSSAELADAANAACKALNQLTQPLLLVTGLQGKDNNEFSGVEPTLRQEEQNLLEPKAPQELLAQPNSEEQMDDELKSDSSIKFKM